MTSTWPCPDNSKCKTAPEANCSDNPKLWTVCTIKGPDHSLKRSLQNQLPAQFHVITSLQLSGSTNRRESAKAERSEIYPRQKCTVRTVVVRRGKNLLVCDPGSESRLPVGGREKTGEDVIHGMGNEVQIPGSRQSPRSIV